MQALLSLSSIASKTLSQESLDVDVEVEKHSSITRSLSTAIPLNSSIVIPPPPPPTPVNSTNIEQSNNGNFDDDDDLYEETVSPRSRRKKRQKTNAGNAIQQESSVEDLKKELKTKQKEIDKLQKELVQYKDIVHQKSSELEGLFFLFFSFFFFPEKNRKFLPLFSYIVVRFNFH
jgi:hypothetical protein